MKFNWKFVHFLLLMFIMCYLIQPLPARLNHRQLILETESGWSNWYDLHNRDVQLEQLEIRRHAPTIDGHPSSAAAESSASASSDEIISAESEQPKFLQYTADDLPGQLSRLISLPTMKQLNSTYTRLFSRPRHYEQPQEKRRFQRLIRDQLASTGYEMIEQHFRVRHLQLNSQNPLANRILNQVGQNLIAILPGRNSPEAIRLSGSNNGRERRHSDESSTGSGDTSSWRISSKLLELLNFVRENKIDKRFFAPFNSNSTEKNDYIMDSSTTAVPMPSAFSSVNDTLIAEAAELRRSPLRKPTPIPGLAQTGSSNSGVDENVIVLGAHYDTMPTCPGVNDNGSGSMVLLELAKSLSALRYRLKTTIMFVWFDFEESGGLGSMAFVNHYLIPNKLKDQPRKFIGAFIMDMLLTFDTRNNTQLVPLDIAKNFPAALSEMNHNGFKSDFLALWLRTQHDEQLLKRVLVAQKKSKLSNEYHLKLIPMAIPLPATNYNQTHLYKYRTFLRSDHSSFWFASKAHGQFNLPAILFTDLGPWREAHRLCYHKACDDLSQLTNQNLGQLMRVLRLLKQMILDYEVE